MLSLVGIGCGSRTRVYFEIAATMPGRYHLVGAADPDPVRLEETRTLSRNPDFRFFRDDRELFAAGKIADVAVIGTQDHYHVEPCLRAMELGYDVLLEKPIATTFEEVEALEATRRRLGRKVMVCHVLRYAPFYRRVHDIIASGQLGRVLSIDMREGVDRWHYAHAYIRGPWSVTAESNPMILSKSSHDCDLLSWMAGAPCRSVLSRGSLSFFRPENAPEDAPARCTDGCPHNGTCHYDALHYLGKHRDFWLPLIMPGAASASDQDIRRFLEEGPFGRCVWRCDNDVVDHQVLALEFDNQVTATFTMAAVGEGRDLVIGGTAATLRGGQRTKQLCGHDIAIQHADGSETFEDIPLPGAGFEGHFGGDYGLVDALDREFSLPPEDMLTGLTASVESHRIAFDAERDRLSHGIMQS